jgi:hypothetical protein
MEEHKKGKEEPGEPKESNQAADGQDTQQGGHATRQNFFECKCGRLVMTSDQ